MALVDAEIKMQGNDNTWFTTNAATVYPANIQIFHTDGRYKFTDGVTALSVLPFLGSGGGGGSLGLIQIIDKEGEFFTDLATATAYIEQYFNPSIITDKSFNNGVFYFTVPSSTSTENVVVGFLSAADGISTNSASFIDEYGLVSSFISASNFERNSGYHIMGNVDFQLGDFNEFSGIAKIKSINAISVPLNYFGLNSTGKFIIEGNLGSTETANFGATFFSGSTATIFANASKYTSNAGGIQGDLQTAITNGCNVFFDGIDKAPIASPTFTGTVTTPAIIVSSETASRVAIFDGSKNVKSADTAIYPNLTEFSYGKGVTSPLQNQLDAKGVFQAKFSGKYKTIPFSGIPGSIAGWLGNIFYIPIPINETQTFTSIRQEVTVAVASSNIRLAVYSDNNGLPDSRLDDSGNLSSATTGSKDYTLSSPITVNASSKQIWVAIQVSSNVLQLRYILNSICLNYLNGSGIQTALYIQAQAFGAFPATATPVIYINANAPLVSLLMQ